MKQDSKYAALMPPENLDVCRENLDLFFESMTERHLIWKRRFVDGKPGPWTEDAIFANYKFTNVYRELDRSSQALIRNIILDTRLDFTNLVWKCLVYRLFNNPETFKLFSLIWPNGIPDYGDFHAENAKFKRALTCLRVSGARPFTNAYFIAQTNGTVREDCYAEEVMPAVHAAVPAICDLSVMASTPWEFIKRLKEIPMVADFIAFELYRDLTYIERFTDHCAVPFPVDEFVNVGPGSAFGLSLIFPSRRTQADQIRGFYDLLDMAEDRIGAVCAGKGEEMLYPEWSKEERRYHVSGKFNLTVDNIEHWLCEFSKYWRAYVGFCRQQKFKPLSDRYLYTQNK